MPWLVFSYSLPTKSSSSPRVALWRRLKRIGAIALSGVYVLPARADCLESFQWLKEEVRAAEGEALLMKVERFEGVSDSELIDHFHSARHEDYQELERQVDALSAALADDGPDARLLALGELEKLRRRHGELQRVDYFNSPASATLASRLTQVGRQLAQGGTPEARVEPVDRTKFTGKVWVTRPQPHVDRLACIWLIRKFIDAEASIRYRNTAQPEEVSFDMPDAQFGHVGNLCTFETMIAAFDLEEPALEVLAELVHELDLRDGRYARPEAAGIDAVLAGWRQRRLADEDLEAHGTALFAGLYSSLQTTFGEATKHKLGHLHKEKH